MTRPNKFSYGQWVPATVLLVGLFSITLLLWAERLSDILRNEANIVDAIMDAQINASSTHLWLEHAVYGESVMDAEKIIAGIDQAIDLIDVTLHGGQAEHDWITEPLANPAMRAKAQEIRTLLVTMKGLAQLRIRNPEHAGTGTSIHRRYDEVYLEIFTKARALEALLEEEEVRNVREFRNLFRLVLLIWGVIMVLVMVALRHLERQRRRSAESLLVANERLHAQTEELTVHREHLRELVAERTAELEAAHLRLQTEMTERLQACELLRSTESENQQLSTRLLGAQELERKRISMGLHDELGQSLSIVKLRLRAIEKALGKDQQVLRDDCEALLDYLDQVVEEMRRLSLALSPTILEDLGLTAALRWLIDHLAKLPQPEVTADIADIDRVIPREQWITVYRVMQEALNNVLKHARAKHLAVMVQRCDHSVDFVVEDDGLGFEVTSLTEKGGEPDGFGLQTMTERIRILNGIMNLKSTPGEGTRVAFRIPAIAGDGRS